MYFSVRWDAWIACCLPRCSWYAHQALTLVFKKCKLQLLDKALKVPAMLSMLPSISQILIFHLFLLLLPSFWNKAICSLHLVFQILILQRCSLKTLLVITRFFSSDFLQLVTHLFFSQGDHVGIKNSLKCSYPWEMTLSFGTFLALQKQMMFK